MNAKEFYICPIEPLVRITGFCSAHENCKPMGYFYEGESHDFWESIFVIEGRAGITAGKTAFELGAGEMIFHPPGEFHRIRNEGEKDLRYVVISFSADRFGTDSHRICTFPSPEVVISIVRELRELFEINDRKFLRRLKDPDDRGALQQVVNRLERLIIELLRQREPAVIRRDENDELYSFAVSVMQQHLTKNLSAAEIAAACQTSVSFMQKLFARYTGMGMMRYFMQLRMRRARQLLQSGHRVGEVAGLLGFGDQNYFSTVYRRHFGIPPSKEKKNL